MQDQAAKRQPSRPVHQRLHFFPERQIAAIRHDTDDLGPGFLLVRQSARTPYLAAQRARSWKNSLRKRLVYDYRPRQVLSILLCEIATCHERDTHHAKIIRKNGVVINPCSHRRELAAFTSTLVTHEFMLSGTMKAPDTPCTCGIA